MTLDINKLGFGKHVSEFFGSRTNKGLYEIAFEEVGLLADDWLDQLIDSLSEEEYEALESDPNFSYSTLAEQLASSVDLEIEVTVNVTVNPSVVHTILPS